MAAFTVPHHAFQKAKALREAVADGWRKLCSGRPWLRAKEQYGLVGTIRSLEVTHGENGWHPHLHVLFLLPHLDQSTATEFSDFLFLRWRGIVERSGLGTCTKKVWRFERTEKTQLAGDYVAKWGCDQEVTSTLAKRAKVGGRSPWMLLEDAKAGDKRASALFKEYFLAFFGARQLTWSRDLKALYGVDDRDDETIAATLEISEEEIVTLSPEEWRLIRSKRLRMTLLNAAENGGRDAVLAILDQLGAASSFAQLDRPVNYHRYHAFHL